MVKYDLSHNNQRGSLTIAHRTVNFGIHALYIVQTPTKKGFWKIPSSLWGKGEGDRKSTVDQRYTCIF